LAIPRGACAQATRPPARGGRGREGGVRAPVPNDQAGHKLAQVGTVSEVDKARRATVGIQFGDGRMLGARPMSLHPPNRRPRAAAFGTDNGRSALMAGTALPAPQPTFTLIADFSRGLCRVNKRHSRSASLDIDNRKDLALVGATTAPTTTIPGDRAAISELPLAEAFR